MNLASTLKSCLLSMQQPTSIETWTPIVLELPHSQGDGSFILKERVLIAGLVNESLIVVQVSDFDSPQILGLSGMHYSLGIPSFETMEIYKECLQKEYDPLTVMEDLVALYE